VSEPNFILLYVNSPLDSAKFYENLLGKKPVDVAPTFVMFALESGVMLGLWATTGVEPKATPAGGSEIAFALGSDRDVDERHTTWSTVGISIVQAPTRMDFGYTFVGLDPDGHRLRVFAPRG
jgi:predicted enzyme related to lactoylglutathione lyase